MTLKALVKKFGLLTFFVLLGVVLLTAFGSWQLERLSWKEGLIQTVTDRFSESRLTVEDFLEKVSYFGAHEYQRLALKGRYLHDQEAHLLGRTHEGQVVYHVVTPFLLETGTMVLVDRGWVPSKISASDPAIGRPKGFVEEQAYMRLKTSENFFTPDNVYEKRELYTINPQEYAGKKSLTTLLPFFVVREGKMGSGGTPEESLYPRPQKMALPDMRNNHLQYAITWYSLAVVLVVMYVIFLRQKLRPFIRSSRKKEAEEN